VSSLSLLAAGPVPETPPLEQAVAPNYRRYTGLNHPKNAGMIPVGEGANYGPSARPGQQQTYGPANGKPARGIPGVSGSVGASPLPVADCLHRTVFETAQGTPANSNFRFGPGGAAPGLASTVQMSEIVNNPPQPEGLSYITGG
jgi:hypothetical protein